MIFLFCNCFFSSSLLLLLLLLLLFYSSLYLFSTAWLLLFHLLFAFSCFCCFLQLIWIHLPFVIRFFIFHFFFVVFSKNPSCIYNLMFNCRISQCQNKIYLLHSMFWQKKNRHLLFIFFYFRNDNKTEKYFGCLVVCLFVCVWIFLPFHI